MKYHHELAFSDAWITEAEAEDLMRMKPRARNRNGFGYSLITNDPRGDQFIRHALAVLKHHTIPRRVVADSTSYGYVISRFYEPDDLLTAEFLLLTRQKEIQNAIKPPRDERGRLVLRASEAKPDVKIGRLWPNWIIASNTVRSSLESAAEALR